jgi:carotenoid cleavage dioxygenase-like enzyme
LVFGEPLFVPRPGAEQEDDGVLLTVGSNANRAALAVVDAGTLEPVAWARIEVPLPLGFHGSFVSRARDTL